MTTRIHAGTAAVTLAFCAAGALAQPHAATCYNTGANAPEQIGDRNGHSLQVSAGTCLESGGVLDGVVTTQNTLWEHDTGGSKLLSGDGVGRKPGAVIAYRLLEGKLEPVLKDGKPVGWIAKGKGVYTLGTGELAPLAGKTFSWTTRPAGPRRYTIDAVVED